MNSVVETVSMLGLSERRPTLTLRMAREKLGPDAGEAGRLLRTYPGRERP